MAREGIEDQRRAPSPYATVVEKEDLYVLIDQMPTRGNAKLERVAFESGAGEVVRQLIGTERVRWIYDQLFYKDIGQVPETPWHQDTVYGFLDGPGIVRIWMPVDPIPRQTSIEVVRGSHLWNIEYDIIEHIPMLEENVEHTKTSKFSYLVTQADGRPKLPNIEASRDSFDIVGFDVNPGDVVAFDYHILHHAGAGVNLRDKRRALAIVYGNEHAMLKHRPNPIPGPVENAGLTFVDGQSVSDFPMVFRVS
jgi:ectoine hydroxylase-related dioxygenase (phytanoyl-CoA dioxygenase family)